MGERRSREPDSDSRIIEHRTIERETLMHNLRYYSNSHVSIANDATGRFSKEEAKCALMAIELIKCKDSRRIRKICNSIFARQLVRFKFRVTYFSMTLRARRVIFIFAEIRSRNPSS